MSQQTKEEFEFRFAYSPSLKLALDAYAPGAFRRFVEAVLGKHKDRAKYVLRNDDETYKTNFTEYEFYGAFRLYEANESDVAFEFCLPQPKETKIADFVYTNTKPELYIFRSFELKTSSIDVIKMFQMENMGLSFGLLLITLIATVVALKIFNLDFEGILQGLKQKTSPSKKGFNATSLLYHFGFLLLQGMPSMVTRSSARVVSISYQFFAFIFICTIFANIKTELTTNETKFIRNLDDLLEKNPDVHIVYFGSDPLTNLLKDVKEGVLPKLWTRLNDPESINIESLEELTEGLTALERNGYVGVIESILACSVFNTMDLLFQKEVKLFSSKEGLSNIYALSIRKSLEPGPKRYLRSRMFRMEETGIAQYFVDRVFQGSLPVKRIFDSVDRLKMDEGYAIQLKSLKSTFLICFGGLSLSFACFLVEIIIKKV